MIPAGHSRRNRDGITTTSGTTKKYRRLYNPKRNTVLIIYQTTNGNIPATGIKDIFAARFIPLSRDGIFHLMKHIILTTR